MQDFSGKVALITGGASGVGRSLAFALGRKGARIVVGDVDRNAMAQVATDLAALRRRYDAVNIKLDKTGGLTEALALRERALREGHLRHR